jgi:hypothetical protein
MSFQRSCLITFLTIAICTAASALANVSLIATMENCPPCRLTASWRIGTAVIGAFLLSRFIIGTPKAWQGPTAPAISARGLIANVGTVHYRIGGKSSFFSFIRGAQLLGMIVCIACQFVIFQAPVDENIDGRGNRSPDTTHQNRVTA